MLCQEEVHPFQILFIPGIYCNLLDQELLSFPLLSSPISQIYYFMFICFLFTSGKIWKSIHVEVASDSFSLLAASLSESLLEAAGRLGHEIGSAVVRKREQAATAGSQERN